jgi:hypothetical protein
MQYAYILILTYFLISKCKGYITLGIMHDNFSFFFNSLKSLCIILYIKEKYKINNKLEIKKIIQLMSFFVPIYFFN